MIKILHEDDKDWSVNDMREVLPSVLPLVWKYRDRIANDARLYLVHIPNTLVQFATFRIGVLLKCWSKANSFVLSPRNEDAAADPAFVYNIEGNPLVGLVAVNTIHLKTGKLLSYSNHPSIRFSRNASSSGDSNKYHLERFLAYVKAYQEEDDTNQYLAQDIAPASFADLLTRLNEWQLEETKTFICEPGTGDILQGSA